MRIGCCASMIDPVHDPIGIQCIETLQSLGYDYIELSLSHLTFFDEDSFSEVVERIGNSNLPCLACNNFFPSSLRLTGADADLRSNLAYAETAISRASKLGAKTIVFGSSGAKNVPPGYPLDKAWSQIRDLLQRLGPIAAQHDVVLVIEPISRPESNIVLTATDGYRLMQEVDDLNVRLLVDYYHLTTEEESDSIINTAGDTICHLHLATSGDRRFPQTVDASMKSFFQKLSQIHYCGGISIEAHTDNLHRDAALSLSCIQRHLDTQRHLQ